MRGIAWELIQESTSHRSFLAGWEEKRRREEDSIYFLPWMHTLGQDRYLREGDFLLRGGDCLFSISLIPSWVREGSTKLGRSYGHGLLTKAGLSK